MNIPWLKDYSTAPCDPRSFRNQKDLQIPLPPQIDGVLAGHSQIEVRTQLKSLTTQLRNAAVSLEMTAWMDRVHWTRNVDATKHRWHGVMTTWCWLENSSPTLPCFWKIIMDVLQTGEQKERGERWERVRVRDSQKWVRGQNKIANWCPKCQNVPKSSVIFSNKSLNKTLHIHGALHPHWIAQMTMEFLLRYGLFVFLGYEFPRTLCYHAASQASSIRQDRGG